MKYLIKSYYFLFILLNTAVSSYSQQSSLKVQLSSSFIKPTDTLFIKASETIKKGGMATLFLIIEQKDGMVWEKRWPMLNGQCDAALIIPDSMPQGYYRFHFSVLQNLFTVFGKVKTPDKVSLLNSTLLTKQGDLFESETDVHPDGTFTYKNVLFLEEATLLFAIPEHSNKLLNIEISTVLDSVILPHNDFITDIFIGEKEPTSNSEKFISKRNQSSDTVQVLETVTVFSKPTNRGEVFNKKYSTGLFKDMNERIINLLDNNSLSNVNSVTQLIQMQVPGITFFSTLQPYANWRGQPVIFYLDEMRTTLFDIEMTPVSDIAIIKAYPPPFFGNIGASGAAVAVYRKRGGLTDDDYKNAFKVKGYSELVSELSAEPDKYL